jgi:hypothetical protein
MTTTTTSLPDPVVLGRLCEYLNYMHSQFPWLKPLAKPREGDIGWEIAGYHASGICIAVRCYIEHPCSMARPFDESLNTFIARHCTETGGSCVEGHHWTVTIRDKIDSFGGLTPKEGDLIVSSLTTPQEDLEPICDVITNLTLTLIDNDEELDVTNEIHHYNCRPSKVTIVPAADGDGDVDMDDGAFEDWVAMDDTGNELSDKWYTTGDLDVPDVDDMECV